MEKDLQTVKKDLETEVSNFKVTLDKMYKAMDAQEAIMIDFEKQILYFILIKFKLFFYKYFIIFTLIID